LDISDGPGGDSSVVLGWRFGGSIAIDILSDDEIWLAHEFFFEEQFALRGAAQMMTVRAAVVVGLDQGPCPTL